MRNRVYRKGACWLPLCWVVGVLPATAAATTLSFDEALALTERVPAVLAAQASEHTKRELDTRVSRLAYNPQLGAQVGYRRELTAEGVAGLASVQQNFSLSGYGAARLRSVHAEEGALAAEVDAVRSQKRLLGARSWLALWGAVTALHEAQSEVALMVEFQAKIERGAQAGAFTQVDVTEARTYLAEARLQTLTVEGEAFDLGIELARSIGRATETPLRPSGPLPEPPLPELSPSLRAHLFDLAGELPEVRARRLVGDGERLRADEAKAQRGTQLALGAQWLHEPSVPYAVLGTVQLQLPIFDHGERERADYLANAERLSGAADEALLAAKADLVTALHEFEHSREIVQQLTASMLPATEANVQLHERLLQVGEGTVLSVLLARRSLAATRARAARAKANHSFSRYKLWLYIKQLGVTETAPGSTSPPEIP